jgi:hypothetical protein
MDFKDSEWGIAGTCDGIGIVDDELVIVDWKTSNELREDYELQVACYYFMFKKFTRLSPKKAYVVKLDKEAGREERPDVVVDLDRRFKTYMKASELYDDMQEIRGDRRVVRKARVREIT